MKVYRPNFEKRGGLVTVVTQNAATGQILMVAYTDENGYIETIRTGKAVYFSTSRNGRWMKGEGESGDFQYIEDILIDCDGDALIYRVDTKMRPACHTQARSCFYRSVKCEQLFEAPKAGKNEELKVIEV